LCTEVLNGLVGEMRRMAREGYVCGRDYNVVTVSINPMDAPAFSFKKRRSYLDELDKRADNEPGWSFLTTGHGQGTNVVEAFRRVKSLANTVGFTFVADNQRQYTEAEKADPVQQDAKLDKAIHRTKDFVHPSVVMVLTPEGKVSRYLGGLAPQNYNAKDLRLAIVEASDGKVGTITDKVLIRCYTYDTHTGNYQPVMNILALVAAPFPFILAGIIYYAWRRSRLERTPPTPAPATPAVAAAP
ncbi:MAG: hypothetical protein ACRCZF_07055, partial [Gemmataceae bacterium]